MRRVRFGLPYAGSAEEAPDHPSWPHPLQVCRMPKDFPVPESTSEPHDETQRHPTLHLQRMWDGVYPITPPEAAHAHSQGGERAQVSNLWS